MRFLTYLSLLLFLFVTTVSKARGESNMETTPANVTAKGQITDEKGMPIPGVTIHIKGTNEGIVSDINGNYSLELPNENAVLVFSFVGMKTQEIVVGNQTVINVVMEEDVSTLDEIVVVGYGTQKKSDITGSVTSVSNERLTTVPSVNFAQALQGAVAGVSITGGTAGAEGSTNIMIRGRNSIKASNTPLIILDGIPYNGSISEINPSDIKSIEVLKDASAAAIYGSRGSNGVILITSKRGEIGKPIISFNAVYGIQQMSNLPHILTGNEFYDFKVTREGEGSITDTEQAVYDSGESVDWIDLATRTGSRQNYTLSVAGATEKVNYFVSGSMLDVTGISVGDDFKRYTSRINLEMEINSWLKLGTNTQLSLTDRGGMGASFGGDHGSFSMNPLTLSHDENGNLTIYPWEDDIYFANPLSNTLAEDRDKAYKIFTNSYLIVDFPFVKGLQYKLNTGIEYNLRNENTYYGRDTKSGYESLGEAATRNRSTENYIIENIITYNRDFGKNSIFVTGLYSFEDEEYHNYLLETEGFPSDVLTWYQSNLALEMSPSSSYSRETLISQMLRLNYAFDSKYLLTVTGRRDGFSGFGSQSKYSFFPSVALGWNIMKENFMQRLSIVSNLKLRLSYGQNGNQAVGAYETLTLMDDRSWIDDNRTAPGFEPDRIGLDNLTWETTTTQNVGLDFGLYDGRFRGTFDFFIANTTDLLLDRQISPVHGLTEITENIGETKNTGFEASLKALVLDVSGFKWNMQANVSYVKNEIVDLNYGVDDIVNRWFIGEPINVNYDYVFGGIWQTEEAEAALIYDAQPGFAKVTDLNEDESINDEDREIIGKTDPDFLWGLTNTFSYKNFTLNLYFHGVHGVTKRNSLLTDNVWTAVRRNTTMKNWWTEENPTNEYWSNHIDANKRGVDIYQNASFVRLKDVTLSYNLASEIAQKIGVKSIRTYVTARNLLTFTEFEGLDPELSSQTTIPLEKEYSFGFVLGF